jgi:hypothetical protein
MSGDDGHTFTSAPPMKAFRGYAVREQEDGHAVGFIRNGRSGRRKAGNPLVGWHIPTIDSPFLRPLRRRG